MRIRERVRREKKKSKRQTDKEREGEREREGRNEGGWKNYRREDGMEWISNLVFLLLALASSFDHMHASSPSLIFVSFWSVLCSCLHISSFVSVSLPLYLPASLPLGLPYTLFRSLPSLLYPPPLISLLCSLPFPQCPHVLVNDPLNPLSLSNHSYSYACLETYANTHAYTCTYIQANKYRHS